MSGDKHLSVMRTHAKTFSFASVFFSKSRMSDVALLYFFCRSVDDCADRNPPQVATPQLKALKSYVLDGKSRQNLALADVVDSLEQKGVRRSYMAELVAGALFDAQAGVIRTHHDFLKYCYQVAGVVGQMMCPILGAKTKEAEGFAVDLGVAMQMTNICRDVLEDAQMGRIYLPKDIMDENQISIKNFMPGATPENLKKIIAQYLSLADRYYESAYQGLAYLPMSSRLCIVLAGEVYRHIGVKLRSRDYDVLMGRVYLTRFEKILVALKASRFIFKKSFWKIPQNKNSLYVLNEVVT